MNILTPKRNHLFLIACILCLTACTSRSSHIRKKEEKKKPVITVTIETQRYFTEAIAGDKFTVVSMVPQGSSPETYDPIPQQLVSLGESKAYLRIGYIGFEQTWMSRLIDNTPHILVFDTSKGIDLIETDERSSHASESCDEHGNHSHAVEPHVWNSAANALILAENTCKALCALDQANEVYYKTRFDSLSHRIQHTDSLIRHRLAIPGAARAFMIYHPALSYFARDYGLQQIAIEENGKEPSPAYLKHLIDEARAKKVNVIFIQPEFDKRNAETIAAQTGAKIIPINPLNYHWEEEMLRIAQALSPTADTTKP
ncbi:metal ABC transporter solute-binding protein, Zn/Mn family [Bacteroides pyogenes]|uniref:metal ABC transporter solute-binding protein, Zn/Mn family n=1 Tax=Bacteroides pyogenes TaxID=310300 RepID=UPI003F9F9005